MYHKILWHNFFPLQQNSLLPIMLTKYARVSLFCPLNKKKTYDTSQITICNDLVAFSTSTSSYEVEPLLLMSSAATY